MGCSNTKAIDHTIPDIRKPILRKSIIPVLSESQMDIIKTTWKTIKQYIANVGILTFVSMFEEHPEIQHTFASFRNRKLEEVQKSSLLRAHAMRVMGTVDRCILCLDGGESIEEIMKELGHVHFQYQVNMNQLKIICPQFLKAVKPYLEGTWSSEVEVAWTKLFDIILACMCYHVECAAFKS
ncbi:hypothetical protein CHS0354_030337 [Potamilus streckersoni]|uniref:Globin domain-containing protein n=1 Tax=Potamilus streckersoni TaxID=2493646 RepID=A0AAE0W6P9_9BIVA|nr:hypothetical protein CHS0354_030337 [Potamilus streckersoni]